MTIKVYVTLKNGVHDPQGKAVLEALSALGFQKEVEQVRMGKYIELTCPRMPPEQVAPVVNRMCEQLLANTVIETYRYEVENNGA